ncbi:MAG: sigma-54-dependent Fis family transcriptional regulator [Proteobacteria bacterium]|nr:sigma-54-dependent Fis family transcriptional regulator [Pseudomonadota bacterium]
MTNNRPKILIVDDKNRYVTLAHELLRDYDYATRCELRGPCWECELRKSCSLTHSHDWSETVSALAKHRDVDVVLLDVTFDLPVERLLLSADRDLEKSRRLQGIEILRKIRQTYGNLPVILMTSMEELRFEDAAEELQVDEFVTMAGSDAFDARSLGLLIERVVARRGSVESLSNFVWGSSAAMARLSRDAKSLGRTSLPVLLLGETGTGKSALAERVIHPSTGRTGPFVIADLAAIPQTLVAAELFGTAAGAFSGAVDRAGCFERAKGGTLFLDEIGNLPEEVQRMLLVTLQSGRFTRLGHGKQLTLDVKLVAATNSDLVAAVRRGAFREDLYARLNPAALLRITPLRERTEDIVQLAEIFTKNTFAAGLDRTLLCSYMKVAGIKGPERAELRIGGRTNRSKTGVTFVLPRRTYGALRSHQWNGNVRELELLMANATVFALSDALSGAEQKRAATSTAPRIIPIPAKLIRELLDASWVRDEPENSSKEQGLRVKISPQDNHRSTIRDVERQIFKHLFYERGGDFYKMAARLVRGDPKANERSVRLRFNQLGLRVRNLKDKS